MNASKLCAAVAAVAGLAAAAQAQLPPAGPAIPPTPQVIKWPGGSLVMNGSEVIVRNSTPGTGSTNLVTGSGNGFGNKIVVDGGAGGVTIVKNARNGIGNKLILNPDDFLLDLDALPAPFKLTVPPRPAPADPVVVPAPEPIPAAAVPIAPPSYKGKANEFWSKKSFSDAHDCNLYWCPATKLWFRYAVEDDTYRPVAAQPVAPDEMK